MRIKAPAKLNLTLHVTGRRADGYHLLNSLMVLTDIEDVIEIQPSPALQFHMTGQTSAALAHEHDDNIVIKAAKLVAEAAGVSPDIAISLEKNIPVGAGLGGGSADAGAMLRLLKAYWQPDISESKWLEIALKLGADVPFCYHNQAALIEGIGEKITDVPKINAVWAVLINPCKPLSTQQVFAHGIEKFTSPNTIPPLNWQNKAEFIAYLNSTKNDLEASAIGLMPEISKILDVLKQQDKLLLARMSGSGATCYGLFDDLEAAKEAEKKIKAANSDWWVKLTALRSRKEL